jgi:RND family efflux transporter MFP subunit
MVLRGMFSQAVSKLEAFVKKAGSVLTMASPLVLYGLRLSASVILALNREFPGKVTRIADALQSGTRTLLTEIDIPNPDGALPPGIYCSVELKVPRKTLSFIIPAEAIIFTRSGLQAAVVKDGKAEIRNVRVTRDLGTQVQVDAGVSAGERVILNPPVNLIDGAKVRPRPEVTAPRK